MADADFSLAAPGHFLYNAGMSWLLKSFYALWLRGRAFLKKLLLKAPKVPGQLFLRDKKTHLPFLEGANLPWLNYGSDFGANAWNPEGGVAKPDNREALRRHILKLKRQGLHSIRWFLFCDGRAGIRFSTTGTPIGPDERLFADIDAALETVSAEGMKIIFVLLDFLWFDKACHVNGVQTGGRSNTVTGAAKQRALRRRVITPLLERYGRSPVILAWDIVNEPEWATRGLGGGIIGPAVSFLAMRRFFKRVVRLIHRHSGHLATVGSSNATGLPLVRGCGLDFYQVHWYDRWESAAPLERRVPEMYLDRPLLLGEFPTKNSTHSSEAIVALSKKSGYCGALAWSLLGTDCFSGMDSDGEEAME
jgi:hypothetical protein